jgi:hypothetical protein
MRQIAEWEGSSPEEFRTAIIPLGSGRGIEAGDYRLLLGKQRTTRFKA